LRIIALTPLTTQSHPLSLHDALPISTGIEHERFLDHSLQLLAFRGFDQAQAVLPRRGNRWQFVPGQVPDKIDPSRLFHGEVYALDRKSTRLNSSHGSISYAVVCLKKK